MKCNEEKMFNIGTGKVQGRHGSVAKQGEKLVVDNVEKTELSMPSFFLFFQ